MPDDTKPSPDPMLTQICGAKRRVLSTLCEILYIVSHCSRFGIDFGNRQTYDTRWYHHTIPSQSYHIWSRCSIKNIFGINIDLRIIPSYVSDVSCSSCDAQQNDISNAIPAKRWVRRFCRISDINIMKHFSKDEFTGAKIEGYVRFTLQRDKEIKWWNIREGEIEW